MSYQGGYYMINEPLIKTGIYQHTDALHRPIPQPMLDAINRVSETPWRLNPMVSRIAVDAVDQAVDLPCLPKMNDVPLPPAVPEGDWATMPKDEKAVIKAERERVHTMNAKSFGHREALLRKVSLMKELKGKTFWFPHAVDWRGRAYALPQDLNPQADDFARGMLEFSEARPLGPDGMYHLALRGAASYGMDKVSFEDRVQWFNDNEALVIDSATNPLDGERLWCEADEPWQFLATCIAWVGYLNQGAAYECHLPIPYDATCSGLQHLSAMGLSEFGGRMVNLTNDTTRHDIYQVVADKAAALIDTDCAEGHIPEAQNWRGHMTRAVCKRPVMTICYGATPMGMRQMLISDGHTDALDGNRAANAKYGVGIILEAITDVLTESKRIMDWLQDCARLTAEQDRAFRFETPIGMQVQQAYHKRNRSRVCTLFGEAILWKEDTKLSIDTKRMVQGIVPNVIHAYDASHLYATVNRATELAGEDLSWSMVHDSFATWAGDSTKIMNVALREEFVSIYENDHLSFLQEKFEASSGVSMPTPPDRGDLAISDVLRSEYFFS